MDDGFLAEKPLCRCGRVQLKVVGKPCGRAIHGGQHAPRVLFPAPPPETWPEAGGGPDPFPDAVQTVIPAAGQRGRSPGRAAARVIPVGFAADLPPLSVAFPGLGDFDWFKGDFVKNSGSVEKFIAAYLSEADRKAVLSGKLKMKTHGL